MSPEVIQTPAQTANTPNSHRPILVYRRVPAFVDSTPVNQLPATEFAGEHRWYHGGTFKTYLTPHYHLVHEAYAVIAGSSTIRLGVGPLDKTQYGVSVNVEKGDLIIHPAGVAHANVDASDDFQYMGFYPDGSPHYTNHFCIDTFPESMRKAQEARAVPVPDSDPVCGGEGPLVQLWRQADKDYARDCARVQEAARVLCG